MNRPSIFYIIDNCPLVVGAEVMESCRGTTHRCWGQGARHIITHTTAYDSVRFRGFCSNLHLTSFPTVPYNLNGA